MIKNNSSYKYPIFFFALIALISFCEISNSAPATTMERNNAACPATILVNGGECEAQPTTQNIIFHKVAFCTALPTAPTSTTATGMTNCSTVFENTAGATVSIVKGTGATPSGTFSAPPVGNYTFAYVELSHVITYKADLVFSSTTLRSSSNVYVSGGVGPNCHTNGATNIFYLGDLRGITCTGNAVGVAVNTNVTVNSLDDGVALYNAIGTEGTVSGVHLYLIQSTGNLASGSGVNTNGNVAKLIVLIPMTATITSDTKSYNLLYNNTRGMDVLQLKTGDNFNVGLSASYFDMIFQVQ